MRPESSERGYIEGRRQAWLKLLSLCLTELGVEPSIIESIMLVVARVDMRQTMVVQRMVINRDLVEIYGDDPALCVTGHVDAPGAKIAIGQTITYVRDDEHHGWLVTEELEGRDDA